MTDRSSKDFNQLVPYTFDAIQSYWVDTWQRSILMLDTLRQRGNIHLEQAAKQAPNVLSFDAELVLDGRTLARPVNYVLVRIKPPQGVAIDRKKRPFIVFDPRAGHGPGIGGMKQDSEIGVAMQAGHPAYFVGFLPNPMPGQTIEDVCVAEAEFVKRVSELEPEAERQAVRHRQLPGRLAAHADGVDRARAVRARSSWPARRCPIGPACAARTRCATWAGCSAAPG